MFTKILIANRGEIACRVAKTARHLGIKTVAIYSSADQDALHVQACDEAYWVGEAPASDSYLQAERILSIAKQTQAQAIHPGYGFLSENAEFAKACAKAGIVFIGPPVAAIEAMGSKTKAKQIMSKAGVPLVPGYHGEAQDLASLNSASQQVGYPQLIKASAGGGGKGMRVVHSPAEFEQALASAQREAKASFGDDKVLIERYLLKPRHIEFQVFSDQHDNTVHLFERDCSAQRRHQKIIEEAPAPNMSRELREKMGQAAIDAAKAIGYVGAGTVEFLLDSNGEFFFMEMNTRLQVEHPVTEMITGQDLVEWQLIVAAGGYLPLQLSDLSINGHAIEVRVYAENPERGFLPSTGRLHYLKPPSLSEMVRLDSGVRQGDQISMYYDPMIAKLIVWGQDRQQALGRLAKALEDYHIVGVSTNLAFLAQLIRLPAFINAQFDTNLIDQQSSSLFADTPETPSTSILILASLYHALSLKQQSQSLQAASLDPYSPWALADGWRASQAGFDVLQWQFANQTHEVILHFQAEKIMLEIAGESYYVQGELIGKHQLRAITEQGQWQATVVALGSDYTVLHEGMNWALRLYDPRKDIDETEVAAGSLVAPMPGSVLDIKVAVGDQVKAGDALMVLMAMKMESTVYAPKDGKVSAIYFAIGDQVNDGDVLLSVE